MSEGAPSDADQSSEVSQSSALESPATQTEENTEKTSSVEAAEDDDDDLSSNFT